MTLVLAGRRNASPTKGLWVLQVRAAGGRGSDRWRPCCAEPSVGFSPSGPPSRLILGHFASGPEAAKDQPQTARGEDFDA